MNSKSESSLSVRTMEARHASLGRRTLEEIRQKRAAERLSKTSSGSDLAKPPTGFVSDGVGIRKSESATRLTENDITGLVSQLQEMQLRNTELEEVHKILSSKLQNKEVENEMLQKRLSDLEQNTVPSLRKALKDVAMEKDAAVVSREDLASQLRTLKRRMKEVEEEQYRAEEDAANLRAELNSLQQQAIQDPQGGMAVPGYSVDHMQAMEIEISNLRSKLEQESQLRQQEYQKLLEEQARTSAIIVQKQELEEKLASMSERASENISEMAKDNTLTMENKERLEKQLHEMAVAVERLESSRQKLLMEIDSQSSQIEQLFEENSSLSSAYQESVGLVAKWENQVKICLEQNEELRGMLDKLRTEQVSIPGPNDGATQALPLDPTSAHFHSIKGELAREQSRAEALSAEVLRLSAHLQLATQAYNNLARLYKPVLKNIENGLMRMKQDGSTMVVR